MSGERGHDDEGRQVSGDNLSRALRGVSAFSVAVLILWGRSASQAAALGSGPSPAIQADNEAQKAEIFRVRLVNDVGGEISVSEDKGGGWRVIG